MKIKDQIGHITETKKPVKRIVSLVPSITEYLCDIGLKEHLVGITKFCIKPEELFEKCTKIGGTKQLKLNLIETLQPDLIIANKEENTKEDIDYLRELFPVYISDVNTLEESYEMMLHVGELTDKRVESTKMVNKIQNLMSELKNKFMGHRVAYFIWKKPYLLCGNKTFIHSMLTHLGFENVAKTTDRYPEMTLNEIQALNPDYCLLSSEPYPFKKSDVIEIDQNLKSKKAVLVDGELFSWYGSRMLHWKNFATELGIQLDKTIH